MILSALALLAFDCWARWQNPDMSETRLLITYWWQYLLLSCITIMCVLWARLDRK